MNPAVPVADVEHPASVPSRAIHPAQTAFDGLAGCGIASPVGDIWTAEGGPQPDERPGEPDPQQPVLPGMEAY